MIATLGVRNLSIENALDVFQQKKRQRIACIVYEILKRGGEADLREFEGSISVNYGIRVKTQEEYIEDLKNAQMIKIEGNKISLSWDNNKIEQWLENQGIVANRRKTKAT